MVLTIFSFIFSLTKNYTIIYFYYYLYFFHVIFKFELIVCVNRVRLVCESRGFHIFVILIYQMKCPFVFLFSQCCRALTRSYKMRLLHKRALGRDNKVLHRVSKHSRSVGHSSVNLTYFTIFG